eukprot:RCo005436
MNRVAVCFVVAAGCLPPRQPCVAQTLWYASAKHRLRRWYNDVASGRMASSPVVVQMKLHVPAFLVVLLKPHFNGLLRLAEGNPAAGLQRTFIASFISTALALEATRQSPKTVLGVFVHVKGGPDTNTPLFEFDANG